MNEVEKMYKNAGVEADYDYFTFFDDKVHKIGRTMHLCKEELKHWLENYQKDYVAIKVIRVDKVYPLFTAEKQLELIKWLGELDMLEIMRTTREDKAWIINSEYGMSGDVYKHTSRMKSFEEALAGLINSLWQDLTDTDKAQIKEILE